MPASFSALQTITSRLRRRIQTTTVGLGDAYSGKKFETVTSV